MNLKPFSLIGKLLLGAAIVATVGCTDYSTDIQEVNDRIDNEVGTSVNDLKSQIASLEAKLQADYATKQEVSALKTSLEGEVADKVASLKNEIAEATANLQSAIDKKADKAEVDAAVAGLQTALENAQADLQAEIANAKAELQKNVEANATAIEGLVARLTALENTVADINKAVETLKTDVSKLQGDLTALQTALDTFKAETGKEIARIDASIDALKAYIDTENEAIYKRIEAVEESMTQMLNVINDRLGELEATDEDLYKSIEEVNKTITNVLNLIADETAEREKAIKAVYDAISAVNDAVKALGEKLEAEIARLEGVDNELRGRLTSAEESIKTIFEKLNKLELRVTTVEGDLNAHKAAFEEYKKEIAAYQETVNGKFDKLDGEIDGINGDIKDLDKRLEELKGLHNELRGEYDKLEKNLNDNYYNKTAIDQKIKEAIAACNKQLDEKVKAINGEIKNINDRLKDLKDTFNKELRSLVFIPQLYVDGIEAVEYTYLDYLELTSDESAELEGEDRSDDSNPVHFKIIDTKKAAFKIKDPSKNLYVNPEYDIEYHMNPSGAEVKETDKLSFVSKDVEVITKATASEAAPKVKSFESIDGVLKVTMNALGQEAAGEGMASIFALQAEVKRQDGKDTVITSDYANLYASDMELVAIAYSKETSDGESCQTGFNHLHSTAADALENVSSIRVKYDEKLNVKDLVETHININSNSKRGVECGVYEDIYPENDFGLSYKFELVDYLSGDHITSDSQHAMIDPVTGVLTPCGVTDGKADANLVGENATVAIGRRPLVLVTVLDAQGRTVLAGYIKVSIVREAAYKVAEPFGWTVKFLCDGSDVETTWDEMVDNILKKTKLSKEEFDRQYGLQMSENDGAVQYNIINGDFVRINESPVDLRLGVVKEVPDELTGTTTNIIDWKLSNADQCRVYQKDGHNETIYVRYVFRNTTPSTIYEGIYVPLAVTVTKPTGTLGVKLSEYWFENQKNAIINVNIPSKGGSTIPWSTDLGNVWEGNKPVVSGNLTGYDRYEKYLYYFAPVQNSFTVDGVKYALSVDSNKVYDKHDHETSGFIVSRNSDIYNLELKYAIDVTRGVFKNTKLSCSVNGAAAVTIATIDQENGVITYEQDNVAKDILNLFASQPASERVHSGLFANIGTVSYSECGIALPVNNEVNPYYFLRPINVIGNTEKSFIDGTDSHLEGANINLFDMLQFSDWRGQKFVKSETDYSNLWYFKYYGVSSVAVDVDNEKVTTDMNGGNIATTKLSEKTDKIKLSYNTGTFISPAPVSGNKISIDWINEADPVKWDNVAHYNGIISKLGFIQYINNGSTVDSAFKLRIPVKIGYDWGFIKTYVDVTVNPTLGN